MTWSMKRLRWEFRMWLGWVLLNITFRVFPMSFSKALMASLLKNMVDRTQDEEWSEDIQKRAVERWDEFLNSLPVLTLTKDNEARE